MREHGEVVLLEAANDLLEQNAVLEAPSGQGDGIEARPARPSIDRWLPAEPYDPVS